MKLNFPLEETAKAIKEAGPENTIKDPTLLLPFLKLYSFIFLNGKQPSGCGKVQREYWTQFFVRNDYTKLIDMIKKAINRTCVPAWNNIKFFSKLGKHVNANIISDEDALKYLKEGYLTKDDFIKLPEVKEEIKEEIQENKEITSGDTQSETEANQEPTPKKKTRKRK